MTTPRIRQHARAAFTLLEVLITCGILVVGLASVAAILPAAAARLGQATAIDRASSAASVAFSEIRLRGLVSLAASTTPAAAWIGESSPTNALTTYGTNALFSSSLIALTTGTLRTGTSPASINTTILTVPPPAALATRINGATGRAFQLGDDVEYSPSTTSRTPENLFRGLSGTSGYRRSRDTICWGAVLVPIPWPNWQNAGAATAHVAVFQKPSTPRALTLSVQGTGTTAQTGIFYSGTAVVAGGVPHCSCVVPAVVQRSLLRACTAVLAIPPPGSPDGPQWLRIRSSWMNAGSTLTDSGTAFVAFAEPVPVGLLRGPIVASANGVTGTASQLTAIAFEGLLLVDSQTLPLD